MQTMYSQGIEISSTWSAFFTPPDHKIVQITDSTPSTVYSVGSTQIDISGEWIAVDKWFIKLAGGIGGETTVVEDLPGLELRTDLMDMNNVWLFRVGRTLIKMDPDGPFNMEEPAWNSQYAFQEPEPEPEP